jgi:hypothetical protein
MTAVRSRRRRKLDHISEGTARGDRFHFRDKNQDAVVNDACSRPDAADAHHLHGKEPSLLLIFEVFAPFLAQILPCPADIFARARQDQQKCMCPAERCEVRAEHVLITLAFTSLLPLPLALDN